MGLNFQYYDGLQPKIRAGIINEHECIVLVMCNFGSYRKTLTQAFDISKRVKGRFSFSFVNFYEIMAEFFRI